jgi:hypothetical protein
MAHPCLPAPACGKQGKQGKQAGQAKNKPAREAHPEVFRLPTCHGFDFCSPHDMIRVLLCKSLES